MRQFIWSDLSSKERADVLQRPASQNRVEITQSVRTIVDDIRARGDDAVANYTRRFDGVDLNVFKVSADDIKSAKATISAEARAAIQLAYDNIYAFHKDQGFKAYQAEITSGVTCSRVTRPMQSVGLYVPGGSAPLVSTALMLGIPSQIAQCPSRILCTPCDASGVINPHILYAASLCGITDIYKIGGAQAIAAMAYGTASVPAVDKIFGPGNAYVTEAKKMVSSDVAGAALDMPAGPSEVCVIATGDTNPIFAAADLLAQAEHDPLSQVLLISTSADKASAIQLEVEQQIKALSRKDIAAKSISNSISIIVPDLDTAIDVSNIYAPEHLILCFENAAPFVERVYNAGSIFVGPYATESAGDYCSGTNHVLPTYGYARAYSGLSVEAFQKTITVQNLTQDGLRSLAPALQTLTDLEGLDAHGNAVSVRIAS